MWEAEQEVRLYRRARRQNVKAAAPAVRKNVEAILR